jgi:CheY-like chemotaxis protein
MQYDLIIMDINMPVLNGLEATKQIREMNMKGEISLGSCMIYMHSAVSEIVM